MSVFRPMASDARETVVRAASAGRAVQRGWSTLGGAGVAVLGAALGLALEYASRKVVATRLGPEGFGATYLTIAAAALVAKLALLGMPAGLRRMVALRHEDRPDLVTASVRAALGMTLPVAVAVAAVACLAAGAVSRFLFREPVPAGTVVAAALAVPALVAADLLVAVLYSMRRTAVAVLASPVVDKLAALVLLIPVLAWLPTSALAAWAMCLGSWAALGLLWCATRGLVLAPGTDGGAVRSSAWELAALCWPIQVAAVAAPLLNRLDQAWIGAHAGAIEVGWFHAALPVAELVQFGLLSTQFVLVPALVRYAAAPDGRALETFFLRVQACLLAAGGLAISVLLAFPEAVLSLLFSAEFAGGAGLLRLLAAAFLIPVLAGPWGPALLALGRTRSHMAATLAGLVALVALDPVLLPRMGTTGAAVARIVAFAAMNGVGIVVLLGWGGTARAALRSLRVVPCIVAACAVGVLSARAAGPSRTLLVGVPAVALTYVACAWTIGLPPRGEWKYLLRRMTTRQA